jgi:hypothetical protein
MNETMYLLDNNVLGTLGPKRRSAAFFSARCGVPAEVAYEARRVAYAEALKPITIEMTPPMLKQLIKVMKTVPVSDNKFIDLYGNKGGADPVLIAMAWALNNPDVPDLFGNRWVIVSHDKAVLAKAQEFGVDTETPEALATFIDAAISALG